MINPLEPCWKELDYFIEPGTEVSKRDLIERISWHVSYYLFTTLKLMSFYRIGKDGKGEIYIL
jgi:hypothetical protein